MVSTKLVEEIKNSISIPVIEGSIRTYNKKLEELHPSVFLRMHYGYRSMHKDVVGVYHDDPFHRFIFISKKMPNYSKIWILLHEIGHYLCDIIEPLLPQG